MNTTQDMIHNPVVAGEVTKIVDETLNKSSDSTDSLKENTPANVMASDGPVSGSVLKPLSSNRISLLQEQSLNTTNDLSVDESFADCLPFNNSLDGREATAGVPEMEQLTNRTVVMEDDEERGDGLHPQVSTNNSVPAVPSDLNSTNEIPLCVKSVPEVNQPAMLDEEEPMDIDNEGEDLIPSQTENQVVNYPDPLPPPPSLQCLEVVQEPTINKVQAETVVVPEPEQELYLNKTLDGSALGIKSQSPEIKQETVLNKTLDVLPAVDPDPCPALNVPEPDLNKTQDLPLPEVIPEPLQFVPEPNIIPDITLDVKIEPEDDQRTRLNETVDKESDLQDATIDVIEPPPVELLEATNGTLTTSAQVNEPVAKEEEAEVPVTECNVAAVKRVEEFKMPNQTMKVSTPESASHPSQLIMNPFDEKAQSKPAADPEVFFSSNDFDFLQNKYYPANSLDPLVRDSVLLKFDPLINHLVPVEGDKSSTGGNLLNLSNGNGLARELIVNGKTAAGPATVGVLENIQELSDHTELVVEEEQDSLFEVFGVKKQDKTSVEGGNQLPSTSLSSSSRVTGPVLAGDEKDNCPTSKLVDVTMSLDVMKNDSNVSANIEALKSNLSDITFDECQLEHPQKSQLPDNKMSNSDAPELCNHNSNNANNNSNSNLKMKELEEKVESLLKRISEKEKQNAKMSSIVEEYERSIASLLKERALTKEAYEKRCIELETERNANYQHLSSLESTFSDLHVKYERSKQLIETLKRSEENLLSDQRQHKDQAYSQELRYEKLKTHAMSQMEVANSRLREDSAQFCQEISRLKALLRKEEITRNSLQEQLNHKTRENEELIKIWDEFKSDGR